MVAAAGRGRSDKPLFDRGPGRSVRTPSSSKLIRLVLRSLPRSADLGNVRWCKVAVTFYRAHGWKPEAPTTKLVEGIEIACIPMSKKLQ